MLIKTAILDDDKVFCDILEHYVKKVNFLELKGIYSGVTDILANDQLKEIDLLFLDIEMPFMNGIEFMESLDGQAPKIIVVSAKRNYGVEAFEQNALDYLHKPVSFARFLKSINKAKEKFLSNGSGTEGTQHIFIRSEGLWLRLDFDTISVIKGDNNQVIIRTDDQQYTSPIRLKEIEEKLPPNRFMRVHRSYIIQLDKITKVDGEVVEVDNRTVPVSKTYIKDLYARLNIER